MSENFPLQNVPGKLTAPDTISDLNTNLELENTKQELQLSLKEQHQTKLELEGKTKEIEQLRSLINEKDEKYKKLDSKKSKNVTSAALKEKTEALIKVI